MIASVSNNIEIKNRDIFQDNSLLMLPDEILTMITSHLYDSSQLESGREIANFGRVCIRTYRISKDPSFDKIINEAKIVFEMLKEANKVKAFLLPRQS